MRSKKVKLFKKYAVLSFAVLFMTTSSSYAVDQVWSDVTDQAPSGEITITNDVTTDGTAINLGAPPVPGGGFNINGNGHTITAGATGNPVDNPSFIINNTPGAVTTITNTNFTGGNIAAGGGAIQNSATLTVKGTDGNKSTFTSNTAGNGGAISNTGAGSVVLENTRFENNSAAFIGSDDNKGFGGAIYNNSTNTGTSLTIIGSEFHRNTAQNYGGAISNLNGKVDISSSSFTENKASTEGGAILNRSIMNITGSSFVDNTATRSGGAIINGLSNSADTTQSADMTISHTLFQGNYAGTGGGAIINTGNSGAYLNTLRIKDGTAFINNGQSVNASGDKIYSLSGGAILNNPRVSGLDTHDGMLIIEGGSAAADKVIFSGNIASSKGGAITNYGTASITNAIFDKNGSNGTQNTNQGGAINNEKMSVGTPDVPQVSAGELTVVNSSFTNNKANTGGAVFNNSSATFIDTDFSGNKASSNIAGGAIYASAGSKTTIKAQNKDVYIGNATSIADITDSISLVGAKDGATGAITKATGNFQAGANRVININSMVMGSVSGGDILADVNVNKADADGTAYNGTVRFNGDAKIQNSNISLYNGMLAFAHDKNLDSSNILNLYGGTLNLLNNEFGTYQMQAKELNLLGNSNIMLDVDLKNEKMDSIIGDNFGKITNDGGFNLNVSGMTSISEAIKDNVKILFTDAPELIGHVTNDGASVIEAPINKYSVTQVTQSGGGLMGGDGEYFMFNKIGNSDSILTGPVAAQGAFLMMDNIYRQSFANMDMVTLMTPEQRTAWKMRNKYAAAGYHTGVFAPNVIPEERDGLYVRPFTNFENVPLKNGPKVSNVSYGTLIGGDSDLVELGHGWDGNFSFFGAYQGSHQTYNGVGIWQNGGSLGGVATAYKGNFWTGVTANIGASAADASTRFGNDQFPILMTGAAWKSGYNWGLMKNKVIIQPSYMMSYTFVNVFDYTNSAGVKVTQDPLNAIEIIPGLRIIGNLKNGWQPYLGLSMTWNVMDKTKFYANEVALTELAVKPYFEYGVGLQKRYGNRFTGFGQAMLRNGGRNGIALTMGFRWALGK